MNTFAAAVSAKTWRTIWKKLKILYEEYKKAY